MVRLEGIHKSFATGFLMRRRHVLCGLDLDVEPGDAYGLLGDNGAGKSTTLRVLLGLARADRGSVTLFGAPLADGRARRRLGYLPETPSFSEQLTALEFLTLGGRLLGLRGAELGRRAMDLLARVDLEHARHVRLRRLSKGMLQRLGLAQALVGDPELLVLDEPMSGLDPQGRKLVRDLILEQRRAGRTVLFSTHILSDVEVVCTRAGILRQGVIAHELRLADLGRLGAHSVEVQVGGLRDEDVARLAPAAREVVRSGTTVLFTVAPGTPLRELVQAVLACGADLQSVQPRRAALEEVFLRATRGAEAAVPPAAAPAPAAAAQTRSVPAC